MLLCMIGYSEVMCAVHVKYCNHLLVVDMAVWHVYRRLWCACCWKNVEKIGMGVRKGILWCRSFLPCLVILWGFHPYMSFLF